MNPAMTPKTQSVCTCVHCEKSVYFEGNYWLLQSPATGQKYEMCAKNPNGRHEVEPVAEPASTGGPRNDQNGPCGVCGSSDPKHDNSHSIPISRPSGPSAPQTSAESKEIKHPKDMSIDELLLEYKQPTLLYRGNALRDEIKSRAPQPVSGDAPKMEGIREMAARLAYDISVYEEKREDAKRGKQQEWAAFDPKQPWCKQFYEIADVIIIPFLRPYFPPLPAKRKSLRRNSCKSN